MRSTHVARRPAEAAADDAHRDEAPRGAKRSDSGSCNLWRPIARGQRRRRQCTSKSSSSLPEARAQQSSTALESSQLPSGQRIDSFGPESVVPMEVAQSAEPTAKSHAPVEEHDESLVPKRQRGRPATHCWPSPGSPEYTVGCPGCDGCSRRHLLRCQQKRIALGFSASSSSRDVLGGVVMSEVEV